MCVPKLFVLCIIIACALLHSNPVTRWQFALDRARTPEALSALHKKITSEMALVSGEDVEIAQRFLDVIERRQAKRPYEDEFKQHAVL